jgi:hypothetical protein
LRTDLESRYRAYAMGRQWGWFNANDVRRMENETPLGPDGDIYLVPANMMAAEHVLNPPEPPASAAAPAKESGGQPGKRDDDFAEKAKPMIDHVVSRAARRLVESGRKAVTKDDWTTTLAERLNDHWNVLHESLTPALDALSLSRADAQSNGMKAATDLDRQLNVELGGLFAMTDDRQARSLKWETWSERFLNELVPRTVDAIVKAYE